MRRGLVLSLLVALALSWPPALAMAGTLKSVEVVDGWVVPCDGVVHTSPQATFPATIYIRRAYTHVEAPSGTAFNVWLLVPGSNVFFGALNDWVPGTADRMDWRTARESYSPDWIVLPAGWALIVQASCGLGPYINTLAGVWYTETAP